MIRCTDIGMRYLLVALSAVSLPVTTYAQDQVVAPEIYSAIERKFAVDEALDGRDPSALPTEVLGKIIEDSLVKSALADIGTVTNQGDEYTFITGLSGTAQGMLPYGTYEVTLRPIGDVQMVLASSRIVVAKSQPNELLIGMRNRKGKGVVSYASDTAKNPILERLRGLRDQFARRMAMVLSRVPFLTNLQKYDSRVSGRETSTYVAGAAITTRPMTVKLYRDTNNNGLYDPSEKTVPWANVQVILKKISTEQPLSLQAGNNTVQLDPVPRNTSTAYDLVTETVLSGVSEATLVDSITGSAVASKGNQLYGEDFPIVSGRPYYLTIPQTTSLTLILAK